MARRKEAHGGGHGWFVTFADLMGLLVSFFVMLVAFSNQDAKKVQAVAGSMQEAFGVQKTPNDSGVVESDSRAPHPAIKNAAHVRPEDSSVTPTPNEKGADSTYRRAFALAAASLRQILEGMPELAEASKHMMIEESSKGLDIEIVDQNSRSMFSEGSKEPFEWARQLIQKIAGPLKATPYRIAITGHTSSASQAWRSATGPGSFRPTGPMPCVRSWRRKAILRRISTRWREKPIPNRCSLRTRRWHQIAASPSL